VGRARHRQASFREALTILHQLGADESASHGLALDGLGDVAEARQQWDDALARYSSAHEILVRVHGPDAPTSRREADKADGVRKRV
jgi:hypothetical protein